MSKTNRPSGLYLYRDASYRECLGHIPQLADLQALAPEFPSLEGMNGVDPWCTESLLWQQHQSVCHQTRQSIQFLVSLWGDGDADFDVHEALQLWDGTHRQVFLSWYQHPFWLNSTTSRSTSGNQVLRRLQRVVSRLLSSCSFPMSLHHFPSGHRIEVDEPDGHLTKCEKAFKVQVLARKFPSLRRLPGIDPWDVQRLADEVIPTVTDQTRHSVLFVLSVWDSSIHRYCDVPKFCIHRALPYWDEVHRHAFDQWAVNPWWL